MTRNQFLLLGMMINVDKNFILICKGVLSNTLEGTASKIFPGGKPPEPKLPPTSLMQATIFGTYFFTYLGQTYNIETLLGP